MKTNTESKETPSVRTTFVPVVSDSDAYSQFAKSCEKPNMPAVRNFETVMRQMSHVTKSFTVQDVFRECKNFGIPYSETKMLFDVWLEIMTRHGKVETIAGAYDLPTHIFLN